MKDKEDIDKYGDGKTPTYCRNCKENNISIVSEDKTHYSCPKCRKAK
jgi:predicted RNA-binding Zn-ribbon protein involved in translation (DUF1610 family)